MADFIGRIVRAKNGFTQRRYQLPAAVPPGGAVGAAHQTAATRAMYTLAAGNRAASRPGAPRKRKRRAKVRRIRRAPRRGGKKGNRFVKGSAAAKRFMAKLRRMQKRKRR